MRKQLFSLILAAFMAAMFTSIALAQEAAQPAAADEEKTELYRKYYDAPKTTPEQLKVAYEIAKEYLKKYGADSDPYTTAVKKWVAKQDAQARVSANVADLNQAVTAKDYPRILTLGRQFLETQPDNFAVLVHVANAGFVKARAGDKSLNTETIAYARKAIQLLDSNKVTDPTPMASIDDARGFLSFSLATLLQDTAPAEAIAAFLRAAKEGGTFKTDPQTFYLLGATIYNKEYEPLAKEYSVAYAGKDETPESKAMLDKAKAVANRAIDAMARAVALATKPEQKAMKADMVAALTDIYKDFHNGSDAGLTELIAGALSKPMP